MLLKMPREGEPHWWIRPFTFNKTHKRTDPKPVKICMAPFISTHKLKPAQGLNRSSCNRLFRYGLMPHILKCNAFPELAGDRDLSDGTELRGKQDHKCNLLKMLCGFLHFCRDEESNGLCLCKHCSLFWKKPPLFLLPQLQSKYLESPFLCHFPFPSIAWVCSLPFGNPYGSFHWHQLDAEQMNLFNQFLKMANFPCTCFGIPQD